ncbi:MAG TPA: nucleotide sugar epimerase, partial [Opitutae bacterium]|nr:nucleotide sugar epimerase [Opitutae bacterium]
NFQFSRIDIEDRVSLEAVFKQETFDAVFNIAARAGVRYSMENPYVYMSTNAAGTLNLLECMRECGVGKIILASTSSLYAGQPMPFEESLPVNTPISPYAASKKAAEVMAYTYHYLYGIDVSVVRYFTVYGPAGRPDMSVFRFIAWIDQGIPLTVFGDGSQSRDFTYIDDIASGTILAEKSLGYEVINLGGGNNPFSLKALIETIEHCLGKKAVIDEKPFHKADMQVTWANIDKAKQLLGWEPTIGFQTGVERSVQWYIDNRDWLRSIKL